MTRPQRENNKYSGYDIRGILQQVHSQLSARLEINPQRPDEICFKDGQTLEYIEGSFDSWLIRTDGSEENKEESKKNFFSKNASKICIYQKKAVILRRK